MPPAGRSHSAHSILLQQQAVLADFGMLAFREHDLDLILQQAAALVARGLDVERAKVLEILPERGELLVRAGVGWDSGVVGQAVLGPDSKSAPGYAIEIGGPVVSPDLDIEERFDPGDLLRAHGVKSMVNVVIPGGGRPFGVLEVDDTAPRTFNEGDIAFLQNYANLLAAAIDRHTVHQALVVAAAEQQSLLQELQHRVKNNLQVINTLIALQRRRTKSPEVASELEVIASRVETLRLVHGKLYATRDLRTVELGTYLHELCMNLFDFHAEETTHITLDLSLSEIPIYVDAAVPIALIVNEFITNSVKHAFPAKRGRVIVALESHKPGQARLTLADDGIGMPKDVVATTGSGLQLIEVLARQVRAQLDWSADGGTRASLTFGTNR